MTITMTPAKSILVIDDDRFFVRIVRHQAKMSGYSVEEYNDPTKLNLARLCYFSVIILDIMMPVINGVLLLESIRKHAPGAKVVLMTSIGEDAISSIQQLAAGIGIVIAGVLHKPFKTSELAEILGNPAIKEAPESKAIDTRNQDTDATFSMPVIIHFQPQFLLATGRWAGGEVLLWPEDGQAPSSPNPAIRKAAPDLPISVDIINLAMLSMKQAQLAAWGRLSLWAHVTEEQMAKAELPDTLIAAINLHGFQPNLLVLELTEPAHPAAGSQLEINIRRLRQFGIKLAIKYQTRDYAESYQSNPSYDDIRIDRRLIENANRFQSVRTLVTNILVHATHLCITTTAEGIADADTYKWLCAAGCNFGQGPLIAGAMQIDRLIKWQISRQPAANQSAGIRA